jgi:RNA polymerase sigma-70 factor (ECF subfamily)
MQVYSEFSDIELLSLLKAGKHAAFAEIFERYNDLLYTHAYNKVRNKEDARDIVQDVFIKLWNKHEQLEITNNLPGYLYVMTRNATLSLISHKNIVGNYANSFNEYRINHEAVTDHLIREKQFAQIIENEIAALPPRMREAFELSRKHHLTNKQIAERMGISEDTVAFQIKMALKHLRPRIGLILLIVHNLL